MAAELSLLVLACVVRARVQAASGGTCCILFIEKQVARSLVRWLLFIWATTTRQVSLTLLLSPTLSNLREEKGDDKPFACLASF